MIIMVTIRETSDHYGEKENDKNYQKKDKSLPERDL